MKRFLLLSILPFAAFAQKPVKSNILFDSDKYFPSAANDSIIDSVVNVMRPCRACKLNIVGYTDNTAETGYNLILSQNRAKEIYKLLMSKGIDAARLSYVGFGESNPCASNNTEHGKRQNRRVEFIFIGYQACTGIYRYGSPEYLLQQSRLQQDESDPDVIQNSLRNGQTIIGKSSGRSVQNGSRQYSSGQRRSMQNESSQNISEQSSSEDNALQSIYPAGLSKNGAGKYIPQKKISFQKVYQTRARKILLKVYDGVIMDGDIITIKINDRLIVQKCMVTESKKVFEIDSLKFGKNIMEVIALNQGWIGAATPNVIIDDGVNNQGFMIDATLKEPAYVLIEVVP